MFKREISQKILDLSEKFPVITVTGPRQSGKTTLLTCRQDGYIPPPPLLILGTPKG